MKLFYLFIFLWQMIPMSQGHAKTSQCLDQKMISSYRPTYAKGFEIQYYADFKIIKNLFSKSAVIQTSKKLNCETNLFQIKSEINRVAMTSTTYLPLLIELKKEDKLVGFQGKQYIGGKQFDLSKVVDLGYELSKEVLVGLKSDLIIAYDLNLKNSLADFHALKIPLVLNDDYKEVHPLARLEWIIYNAAFFNEEQFFINVFNAKKDNYLKLKKQVKNHNQVVLVGDIQNGTWSTPGNQTNQGILFTDAGATLAIDVKSDKTQFLNLEYVLSLKKKPTYWVPNNFWNSKEDIKKQKEFHVYSRFLNLKIFNNNKKQNRQGFNEYWQDGQYYPDQILEDLINIFNQQTNNLTWYQELK